MQHHNATDRSDEQSVKNALRAARDLVSGANDAGADRVAVDIRVEECGPVVVVEDDGRGMTAEHIESFFEPGNADQPFYGADEIHISTTRDGTTLKAHSNEPPAYSVSRLDPASWEEGTRAEVRGLDAAADITERLDEETVREKLALDASDWTAVVNIHVDPPDRAERTPPKA